MDEEAMITTKATTKVSLPEKQLSVNRPQPMGVTVEFT